MNEWLVEAKKEEEEENEQVFVCVHVKATFLCALGSLSDLTC